MLEGITVLFKMSISLEIFLGKWLKEITFAEIKSANLHAIHIVVFSTTLMCLALEGMMRI